MMINIVHTKTIKFSKVLLILSCFIITLLNAKSHEEKSIDSIDRVLNKQKHLGECEGNCHNDINCAYGYSCSRRHKDALLAKGHDPRLAYCPSDLSMGGYVCYDPWKAEYPSCPYDMCGSEVCNPSDTGFFNNTKECILISFFYCCRPSTGRFNQTHMKCRKGQKCDTYSVCECLKTTKGKGEIYCEHQDSMCVDEYSCA